VAQLLQARDLTTVRQMGTPAPVAPGRNSALTPAGASSIVHALAASGLPAGEAGIWVCDLSESNVE
jgi:hypothetical protein